MMKIFILNSSGNVGKSLLARELFFPRLENCKIIEIETVNSGNSDFDSLNVSKYKADDDFTDIYMDILENDNVILDVGASNLALFWDKMSEFAGVDTIFDIFVVPTGVRAKLQEDTYKTILFLQGEGIPNEKIKVIFNGVENTVSEDFKMLLSVDFDFDEELFIRKNEVLFNDLGFLKKTIKDIFQEDVNYYKSLILNETDKKQKLLLIKTDLSNRQSATMKKQMDLVFEKVTGLESAWVVENKGDNTDEDDEDL